MSKKYYSEEGDVISFDELTPKEQKNILKRRRRKRKLILFIIEVFFLLILLAVLYLWNSLDKIEKVDPIQTKEELAINEDIDEEVQEILKGYTDVAIFGVDNRSNGNADTGNSDVIMVASINNDTKEVRLVSVYRDTMLDAAVQESEPKYRKANYAYNHGGAAASVAMLNANLDLDIEKYVTVDFRAVTDVVDALGGVEIEIDSAELKWMNSYIRTTAEVTGEEIHYLYEPGVYNLDGTQATAYCRIRYTKGDDYARSSRQREVINQVVKKAKKCNLVQINNIINNVFPEVATNFTNTEIIGLAADLLSYELVDTAGFPFNKHAKDLGGATGSVVVPCDLVSNVSALHHYLYGAEKYVPSSRVQAYNSDIFIKSGLGVDSGDKPEAVLEGMIESDSFE